MDTPTAILLITTAVIMLVTIIATSYKTGTVVYSIWSSTRLNQPKFSVNRSKIGSYALSILVVFIINLLYCMIVLRDINEIQGMLILSLFNTLVIGYGLSFWFLLEEKHVPISKHE